MSDTTSVNSYRKILFQLSVVAKKPFTCNGTEYYPPSSLKISPSFWRSYACPPHCGACCSSYTLDYIETEYEQLPVEFRTNFIQSIISINGDEKIIYTYHPPAQTHHNKKWCGYLQMDTGLCGIHQYKPISCKTELIKFHKIGNVGYIRKMAMGRSGRMVCCTGEKGAKCAIGKFSHNQLITNDIPVLRELLRWSEYFGVETCLKDIIKTCMHKQ